MAKFVFRVIQSQGEPESPGFRATGYTRVSKWNGHNTFTDCSKPDNGYKRCDQE